MLTFRQAKKTEAKAIQNILEELDLSYPGQTMDSFWIAENYNQIIGVVRIQDCGKYYFLSSLGVTSSEQQKGIGSFIMKELIKIADKAGQAIYLYTIIPEFFAQVGFKITPANSSLPSKSAYQCEECFPEKCVCMLKSPNVHS